jgi:hypothetical protein
MIAPIRAEVKPLGLLRSAGRLLFLALKKGGRLSLPLDQEEGSQKRCRRLAFRHRDNSRFQTRLPADQRAFSTPKCM